MAIDKQKARDFVYSNGVLWERALWGWLFEGRPIETLHGALLAYKNADGGYGHALEHDIRTPDSHPLALEYLLMILGRYNVPVGNLLDGTLSWLDGVQQADGTLTQPDSLYTYPYAPWRGAEDLGGQQEPDSIVGNLTKLGQATPQLSETTRSWVQRERTLDKIAAFEWLFMCYHLYDYFFNVTDFPDLGTYQQATVEAIVRCADKATDAQLGAILTFVPHPDAPLADRIPQRFVDKALDMLLEGQQDDGSWHDEHGLVQWFPIQTISALVTLERYGKL